LFQEIYFYSENRKCHLVDATRIEIPKWSIRLGKGAEMFYRNYDDISLGSIYVSSGKSC
jgi:hypothetical protein